MFCVDIVSDRGRGWGSGSGGRGGHGGRGGRGHGSSGDGNLAATILCIAVDDVVTLARGGCEPDRACPGTGEAGCGASRESTFRKGGCSGVETRCSRLRFRLLISRV